MEATHVTTVDVYTTLGITPLSEGLNGPYDLQVCYASHGGADHPPSMVTIGTIEHTSLARMLGRPLDALVSDLLKTQTRVELDMTLHLRTEARRT